MTEDEIPPCLAHRGALFISVLDGPQLLTANTARVRSLDSFHPQP